MRYVRFQFGAMRRSAANIAASCAGRRWPRILRAAQWPCGRELVRLRGRPLGSSSPPPLIASTGLILGWASVGCTPPAGRDIACYHGLAIRPSSAAADKPARGFSWASSPRQIRLQTVGYMPPSPKDPATTGQWRRMPPRWRLQRPYTARVRLPHCRLPTGAFSTAKLICTELPAHFDAYPVAAPRREQRRRFAGLGEKQRAKLAPFRISLCS